MNEYNKVTKADAGNSFTTEKFYNPMGMLQLIKVAGQNSTLMRYGYTFDPVTGNLQNRSDDIRNFTEIFTYDNADRLKASQSNVLGSSVPQLLNYAASGNITSKSDVGTYKYNGPQPHAVCCLENAQPSIPDPQQDITYTGFNKTATLSQDLYSLNITYGPDYKRHKQVFSKVFAGSLQVVQAKIYSGSYEKVSVSGSPVARELHYISGGDGLCAILVKRGEQDSMYYINTDHVGSIALITAPNANKLGEYSYDSWGRRRNPDDLTYTLSSAASPLYFDRGYTGHEHLDRFGLINMNGRMYDPVLARVLSPDNYVPSASSVQDFNRYTYALNNPHKFVDPDGNSRRLPIYMNPDPYIADAYDLMFYNKGLSNIPPRSVMLYDMYKGLYDEQLKNLSLMRASYSDGVGSGGLLQQVFSSLLSVTPIAGPLIGFVKAAREGNVRGAVANIALGALDLGVLANMGSTSVRGIATHEINSGLRETAIATYYPQNNGFIGNVERQYLMPGDLIDRYGAATGSFLSPAGIPFDMRALPFGANTNSYNLYEVIKPFEVQSGVVAPAFNQIGLGTQYLSPVPVQTLLDKNIIQQVTIPNFNYFGSQIKIGYGY